MEIRNEHARFLAQACQQLLGCGHRGDIAFTRCLPPDVVRALCANTETFRVEGWDLYGVTGEDDRTKRLLPGDQAVELREDKGEKPILFLIDTAHAGAGLDGIYNSSRELHEADLLLNAGAAARETLPDAERRFAEAAVKRATPHGGQRLLAPWRVFDFYTRATLAPKAVGPAVAVLGLWPIELGEEPRIEDLDVAARVADRLLPALGDARTPGERIDALLLPPEEVTQRGHLERFLRAAAGRSPAESFGDLAAEDQAELRLNRLNPGFVNQDVKRLALDPWTNKQGKLFAWSGLDARGADGLLEYRIASAPEDASADQPVNRKPLEVRWRVEPTGLTKGRLDYRVTVVTRDDTVVAEDTASHSGSEPQKIRFQPSRFDDLPDNAKLVVRVRVSVVGKEVTAESEDFLILYAPTEATPTATPTGARVRCLIEGLIACETEGEAEVAAGNPSTRKEEPPGTLTFTPVQGQTYYRVPRPTLIRAAEEDWLKRLPEIGRWRAWTRADGMWDADKGLDFVPFGPDAYPNWDKLRKAASEFAKDALERGGVIGRVSVGSDKVGKDYVKRWAEALSQGPPILALAHTVEVLLPGGQPAGLLVLPSHPVRVAWQMGYDQLALDARYKRSMKPRDVREALSQLDSDSFPAMLPGPDSGAVYVFGALLGLSVVGMVLDADPEPRSTVALLARCLGGENQEDDTASEAARAVAREIRTYLDFHDPPRVLHVNAERPGDGAILVRALGEVMAGVTGGSAGEGPETPFEYDLDLYPGVGAAAAMTGRFLTTCAERRRAGAGEIPEAARWMFDSYTTEANIRRPRLRWARRDAVPVDRVAHVSVAFDTFRSRAVVAAPPANGPIHAYGLTSPSQRQCQLNPDAVWWESGPAALDASTAPRHPAGAWLTDQLLDVHRAALVATAKWLGVVEERNWPVLRTDMGPDDRDRLDRLHRYSDWVITVDRQAAVEYFDSPASGDTYDKYIIDCRPEREDLGALQLITSTSNLDEVRSLLDATLGRLGLSSSRQNCEFLLRHLKAISGRLAIRLVSPGTARGELVAIALVQAHCANAPLEDPVWLSARYGVFVPLDDIRDLCREAVPPAGADGEPERQRADLLYVCRGPGAAGGLRFRFVEVKYRGERRSATDSALLESIPQQTEQNARRWTDFFFNEKLCDPVRLLRRSRLVRVLQFYTDKARRHDLDDTTHQQLAREYVRLLEDKTIRPADLEEPHRGYIFCPEVLADQPVRIDVEKGDDTGVFLFGPGRLPHRPVTMTPPPPPVPSPKPESSTPASVPVIDSTPGSIASPVPPLTPVAPLPTVLAPQQLTGDLPVHSVAGLSDEVRVTLGRSMTEQGDEVPWRVSLRGNPHLMMVGLPGMGKTTCLINICAQLQSQGIVPIVFSYHEDIDDRLPKRLGTDVHFLDYNDLGFNPLRIDQPTGTAHIDSAGTMRDVFGAIFPTLGELQLSKIREAIKQSYEVLGWKLNAPNTGLSVPDLSAFFALLRQEPHQDKSHKTLLSRLQELEDYGAFGATGPDRTVLESRDLVVLRIHKAPNEVMQRAFATFVFYKIYRDMFRRGVQTRLTHAVIFDEAHRAGKLQLLPTMAKECRKYGLSLVLASQEVRDFHPSLFSAVANYLALRTVEQDAKALARNVAPSDQEGRIVDRLKQLQKFHALFFAEGSARPIHVRLGE